MNDDLHDEPMIAEELTAEEFAAALGARYQRLALLTLDLAEEAGEAAVNFSHVDRADRAGRFERRIAAMTRAIWAHRVIEGLRLGRNARANGEGAGAASASASGERAGRLASPSETVSPLQTPPGIIADSPAGPAPAFQDLCMAPAPVGGANSVLLTNEDAAPVVETEKDAAIFAGAAEEDGALDAAFEAAVRVALNENAAGLDAFAAMIGSDAQKTPKPREKPT